MRRRSFHLLSIFGKLQLRVVSCELGVDKNSKSKENADYGNQIEFSPTKIAVDSELEMDHQSSCSEW